MANKKLTEKVKDKNIVSIKSLIEKSVSEIGKALPKHMNPQRLARIAYTTLRTTPKLAQCDPMTFLGALFQCAQLGLEPNIEGQAYIIPYWNKKRRIYEAQFQIGYKGLIELFYRHQKSIFIDAHIIYENDKFDYAYGTNAYLIHKPTLKNRGESIGYYAIAELKGTKIFKVMSKEEVLDHAKRFSKCYDKNSDTFIADTPWVTNFDAMGLKTALKLFCKTLPKSIEIQHALAMDETVKRNVKPDMIEVKDEMDWTVDESEEQAKPKEKPDNLPYSLEVDTNDDPFKGIDELELN